MKPFYRYLYYADIVFCILIAVAGSIVAIWSRRTIMEWKAIRAFYGRALIIFIVAVIFKGLFTLEDVWNIKYMLKYILYLGDSYDSLSMILPFAYFCLSVAVTGTILNLINLFVPISKGVSQEEMPRLSEILKSDIRRIPLRKKRGKDDA